VIVLDQVRGLMGANIVDKRLGEAHQPPVEPDRAIGRAGAPAPLLVPHDDLSDRPPQLFRIGLDTRRHQGLALPGIETLQGRREGAGTQLA
jgi:hypothetical protein